MTTEVAEEVEVPKPQPRFKLDELVEKYIKLREKRAALKAKYTQDDAQYSVLQDKIEALLLSKFNEMGVDSVKTASGTAYCDVRSTASIADWDIYCAFLNQQDDPYLFVERRPSKAAIEQYKKDHDGELPPGINWSETRTVNFRRPKISHT